MINFMVNVRKPEAGRGRLPRTNFKLTMLSGGSDGGDPFPGFLQVAGESHCSSGCAVSVREVRNRYVEDAHTLIPKLERRHLGCENECIQPEWVQWTSH
jgi:hypothetical protein